MSVGRRETRQRQERMEVVTWLSDFGGAAIDSSGLKPSRAVAGTSVPDGGPGSKRVERVQTIAGMLLRVRHYSAPQRRISGSLAPSRRSWWPNLQGVEILGHWNFFEAARATAKRNDEQHDGKPGTNYGEAQTSPRTCDFLCPTISSSLELLSYLRIRRIR